MNKYPKQFNQALNFTLKWEGGYSNHPNDSGGSTNKGITQRTYNKYRKEKKLPIRSVINISDKEVKDIYYTMYYLPSNCYKLSPKLAIVVFDFAVHSGPGRAKHYLQKTNDPNDYINRRERFLRSISHGKNRVFLKGWMNRINDLRDYIKTI